MGCKKLTYYQPETPLKVVYRKTEPQQKVVQRFLSVDPISEEFYYLSPFNYAGNSPIANIDLWGLQPYKVTNGLLIGNNVTNDIKSVVERPKMKNVNALVLHRTVSSTAQSAINTAVAGKGVPGFHLVVGKDGIITQIVNLDNKANHVGPPTGDVTSVMST